jgi:FkbM family methyltransferase
MLQGLRTARGVARSLRIYYGDSRRRDAMVELYRTFVQPDDLVFDIGAHVGDRVAAFRKLGARVVAVEPQPALVRTLRLIYGRDRDVHIEAAGIARTPGLIDLHVNTDNPTISSASSAFLEAAGTAQGWREQRWEGSIRVPAVTLDQLIGRYGLPAFIKIDVEGYEAEALAGLTQHVPALSFEFTTIQRDIARACVAKCVELGLRGFNAALGETQRLVHGRWISADEITRWIDALPHDANSGDVYARMV